MFIKLHTPKNKTIYINIFDISVVCPVEEEDKNVTCVFMTGTNNFHFVTEGPLKIMEMINELKQ